MAQWLKSDMGEDRRKCSYCLAHVLVENLDTHKCDPMVKMMYDFFAPKASKEEQRAE